MSAAPESRSLRDAAAVDRLGPDRYGVEVSDHYTVVGRPNGGYLQCLLANAALAAASDGLSDHMHATAVTTNFVTAPNVGPAEVRTSVRRVGRSISFVHVELVQDGAVTSESLVTLGTLADDAAVRYLRSDAPELAPLEQCVARTVVEEIKLMSVVDFRLDPTAAKWLDGGRSELGEVKGWLRLNDGAETWDAWSLLFASDGLPPATFPLGSSGWVPTLQLTSYVHQIPMGEWLRARQWCVVITDSIVEERCELFDVRNELVATSSQLAMVRFRASAS
ncbi:MAG TPA: thioesterase family protein [Acidimicrobiales bacterium]|nr:thioesterase family protein [Acidimicrobiales bacterium]